MRISVDLDKRTLSVTTATGLLDPSSSSSIVPVQQGDSYGVEIVLIKDGAQAELPLPYTNISFGAVPKLTPTSALLFFSESFALIGAGATSVYSALIEFDTEEIESYFVSIGVTAINFDALLQVRISDGTEDNQQTISGLWPVEISRNILENSTPAGAGRSINLTWRPAVVDSSGLKAITTLGSIAIGAAILVSFSTFSAQDTSLWVLEAAAGSTSESDTRKIPDDYDSVNNDKAWHKKELSGTASVNANDLTGDTLAPTIIYSDLTEVGTLVGLTVYSGADIIIHSSANTTVFGDILSLQTYSGTVQFYLDGPSGNFSCVANSFGFATTGGQFSVNGQVVLVRNGDGSNLSGITISQLAGFTSEELLSKLYDETGSGQSVFNTAPTFKTSVKVNNPANTFAYTITPAAISADRTLNLPLVTGTDTLAVLGLAQTWTGIQTFTTPTFKTSVKVNNPANTFAYTITPAAISADRTLNLPLVTGTDTLAVLGLAQTWTGIQTFTAPNVGAATADSLTASGNIVGGSGQPTSYWAVDNSGGVGNSTIRWRVAGVDKFQAQWDNVTNAWYLYNLAAGAFVLTVTSANVVTFTPQVNFSAGISSSGNLSFSASGKGIQLKSGTGARAGNAALVSGTVTVTNTTVTANTIILLARKTASGAIGMALTYTLSAGSSFTISSDNVLDTSTVSYMLLELN